MTQEQYLAVLARINRLERLFNDLALAIQKLSSKDQMQQLFIVLQEELANVSAVSTALTARVTSLEEDSELE